MGKTLGHYEIKRAPGIVLGLFLVLSAAAGSACQRERGGEWRSHSADLASTKYSPLDQITAANVSDLRIAWRRPGVDASIMGQAPDLRYSNSLAVTPLMVDGVLYSPNAVGLVEAVDAGSGETIWVQEPVGEKPRAYRGTWTRGVAYWTDGTDERIIVQRGRYLTALNAATGEVYPDFGDGGHVDLAESLGAGRGFRWTGAPTVARDVVLIGQSFGDVFVNREAAGSDVRAFDVRTGAPRWSFHTIPRAGEFGTDTWEDDSWEYTGHAPVWAMFSVDEENGYVYLPVSSSTNDMYGGHRPGANLFSQSLVCVDAATGERVWHYQLVHHGLWDYDPPAAPILMDITVDGRQVKAVVQLTKQAFAFVFDRLTGEPVWPIEERPVPPSDTPGEWTSPTQPFPTKPPAFDRQGATIDNLIDFTPELRAEALEIVSRYTIGPLFTPPSIPSDDPDGPLGTIQLPGSLGGANIQGAGFDPETGYLFVPSITAPFVADIVEGNPETTNLRYVAGRRMWIAGPRGLPLFKPPYGRITAIDMNRGEIVWQAANGEGPRDHPAIRHLDLGPLGYQGRPSPLVTKSLLFVAESGATTPIRSRTPRQMAPEYAPNYGGPWFRAYDKATGEVVGEIELPARATGAPISYMHEGRQYIVLAIGDRSHAAELVALALER